MNLDALYPPIEPYETGELLVGDGKLRAQPLEAVAHIDQAALEQSARHRTAQSTRAGLLESALCGSVGSVRKP